MLQIRPLILSFDKKKSYECRKEVIMSTEKNAYEPIPQKIISNMPFEDFSDNI